jgi:hypothetical protein
VLKTPNSACNAILCVADECFDIFQKLGSKSRIVVCFRWWAEPDSDRRPLARKANVLTRLDDQPPAFRFV